MATFNNTLGSTKSIQDDIAKTQPVKSEKTASKEAIELIVLSTALAAIALIAMMAIGHVLPPMTTLFVISVGFMLIMSLALRLLDKKLQEKELARQHNDIMMQEMHTMSDTYSSKSVDQDPSNPGEQQPNPGGFKNIHTIE